MVGDQQQLPPVVLCQAAEEKGRPGQVKTIFYYFRIGLGGLGQTVAGGKRSVVDGCRWSWIDPSQLLDVVLFL